MKISTINNEDMAIMPMVAAAGPEVTKQPAEGKPLRVAVTKTSAEAQALQASEPNVMCFSKDENSIWFNNRKYGVVVCKDIFDLTQKSDNATIKAALSGLDYTTLMSLLKNVNIFVNFKSNSDLLQPLVVKHQSDESGGDLIIFRGESQLYDKEIITIKHHNNVYSVSVPYSRKEYVGKDDVINNLTSSATDLPLSANQGKILNEKIQALGDVYNIKGSKKTFAEVKAVSSPKKGDVYNVESEFKLNGRRYPAFTNVVYVGDNATKEEKWDALGGVYTQDVRIFNINMPDLKTNFDNSFTKEITNTEDINHMFDNMTEYNSLVDHLHFYWSITCSINSSEIFLSYYFGTDNKIIFSGVVPSPTGYNVGRITIIYDTTAQKVTINYSSGLIE